MSNPILLLLAPLPAAFLLLALLAGILPAATGLLASVVLSGLGLLLSLAAVLARVAPAAMTLPAGPPGLSLHLALDALSGCFLVLAMAAATGITALLAREPGPLRDGAIRPVATCIAGILVVLLAGDGITLTIGLALAAAAIWPPFGPAGASQSGTGQTEISETGISQTGINQTRLSQTGTGHAAYGQTGAGQTGAAALLIPLLLLAAASLLTPAGFAPRFDTIRAAPPQLLHATAGALLAIAGLVALIALPAAARSPARDAVHAGLLLPAALYALLRLVMDVSAAAAQPLWGAVMMLSGGAIAARQGWLAGAAREVDLVAGALARCQAGLAMAGTGLALQARLADLPTGSGDALAATLLLAAAGLPATVVTLAAHVASASAGTYRLARLGGLLALMPATAAALCGSLLAVSAVPTSLGFAALWLLLRAVLAAPRTGGLLAQCVLALTAAAIAASAALATTAALRLAGIALLSRPRTPRGSSAREAGPTARAVLVGLSGLALLIGILPGPVLTVLAGPVVRNLTGVAIGLDSGAVVADPAYRALPVVALLGFCIGVVLLIRRWRRREIRVAPAWLDGAEPPYGLPFGDPVAQSAGQGFVPSLPTLPWRLPKRPALPVWPQRWPWPPSHTGLWLILLGATACLVVLALGGATK